MSRAFHRPSWSSLPQPWRRLVIAAVLSGAAHAAAVMFGAIGLPPLPRDLPPLAVRVVRVDEPPASPVTINRARVARREAGGVPVRPAPGLGPAPSSQAAEGDAPIVSENAAPELPAASEPVIVATAPAAVSEFTPDPASLPAFPRRGRVSFNIVYGRDGFPVGRTEQSWQIDGTRYQLASRSETTGMLDMVRSQHRTYLSKGELTPKGLRPDTFLMSRNRGRGSEEARAQFDWSQGTVTLGAANAQREQALPIGTQDLVSFMYQLALDPPKPGRTTVSVTNGSRLETYELDVRAEEKIDTPLGVMRALPIRQVRSARAESVELWLATEIRHLPVRIRFYGRDGEPAGEQIVTEIRLTED